MACLQNMEAFRYVSTELSHGKSFVMELLEHNALLYAYLDCDELSNDEDILDILEDITMTEDELVVMGKLGTVNLLSCQFAQDEEFIIRVTKKCVRMSNSWELFLQRPIILPTLNQLLPRFTECIYNNELVLKCIHEYECVFLLLPEEYLMDKTFILQAIESNPNCYLLLKQQSDIFTWIWKYNWQQSKVMACWLDIFQNPIDKLFWKL